MTGEPTYTKVIRKSGRVEWNGKIEVTFPPDDSPFGRMPRVLSTREGGWFAWTRRRLERKLDRAIREDRKLRVEPGEAIRVPAKGSRENPLTAADLPFVAEEGGVYWFAVEVAGAGDDGRYDGDAGARRDGDGVSVLGTGGGDVAADEAVTVVPGLLDDLRARMNAEGCLCLWSRCPVHGEGMGLLARAYVEIEGMRRAAVTDPEASDEANAWAVATYVPGRGDPPVGMRGVNVGGGTVLPAIVTASLLAAARELNEMVGVVYEAWKAMPSYGSPGCTCGSHGTPSTDCPVHAVAVAFERAGLDFHRAEALATAIPLGVDLRALIVSAAKKRGLEPGALIEQSIVDYVMKLPEDPEGPS